MKIKILIIKVFLLFICLPVNAEMMYTAEVTASSLNIRSIPNNEGRIIGSLYRGQKILVTSTSDEWVKTILEGNEIGYISSIYLKMVNVDTNIQLAPIDAKKNKCDLEAENVDLSIIDVNMECRDSLITSGYESCTAKFDINIESHCDAIVDVEVNCSADFKYNTSDGFAPYNITENNSEAVYTNNGQGNTIVEVTLIPPTTSAPVVKVELVDGVCSVIATNYF